MSKKNLDDIYLQIMGNPTIGDLDALERHYRMIKEDIEANQESPKVDLSTIQKHGELHNAYMYLKTKWSLKRQIESGLIVDGVNLQKEKALRHSKNKDSITGGHDHLHAFHKKLKSIAKAGAIIIILAAVIQISKDLLINMGSGIASAVQGASN